MPPFRVLVVDDDGDEVPPGTEGRLFFEDATGRGIVYPGDPEKTAAAHLRPGVFTLGEIGYVTDDGFVYITDRFSDMIVSGGVNIYPAESEQVLIEHPQVADVAVIGVPNVAMGEAVKALVVRDRRGRSAHRRRAHRVVPRAARRLQVPTLGRLRGDRRSHRDGEGQQARAAAAVLGVDGTASMSARGPKPVPRSSGWILASSPCVPLGFPESAFTFGLGAEPPDMSRRCAGERQRACPVRRAQAQWASRSGGEGSSAAAGRGAGASSGTASTLLASSTWRTRPVSGSAPSTDISSPRARSSGPSSATPSTRSTSEARAPAADPEHPTVAIELANERFLDQYRREAPMHSLLEQLAPLDDACRELYLSRTQARR